MKKLGTLLLAVALALGSMLCFASCALPTEQEETSAVEISEDGFLVVNGEKTELKVTGNNENPQGLQFFLQDDGTYLVAVGGAQYLSQITIPQTYQGRAVVGFAYNGFEECVNLTSITIPDGMTSISGNAFKSCINLTNVVIPNSVTSIGISAFENCTSLTSIQYRGTEEQWSAIEKGERWDYKWNPYQPLNYTITYNYTGE